MSWRISRPGCNPWVKKSLELMGARCVRLLLDRTGQLWRRVGFNFGMLSPVECQDTVYKTVIVTDTQRSK